MQPGSPPALTGLNNLCITKAERALNRRSLNAFLRLLYAIKNEASSREELVESLDKRGETPYDRASVHIFDYSQVERASD
jgi:hypothetical protein